jgi:hypothetical protein
MKITEEIINGEIYNITEHDSGHIIKELKMSDAQKAIINVHQAVIVKNMSDIVTDIANIKADIKIMKEK